MKNVATKIIIIFTALVLFWVVSPVNALLDYGKILSGRILLQVQSHGEAWYVNPTEQKKYYMGRPQDAFNLMKKFGVGITDRDLEKIPIGLIASSSIYDTDGDGLSDDLEKAIGTDLTKTDTDNDGYDDKSEIQGNYNPLGQGRINADNNSINNNLGKIFIQVEKQGQAWYLNPTDKKRYFLNRPTDAFDIMRKLGLGITDYDLSQIAYGYLNITNNNSGDTNGSQNNDSTDVISCPSNNPEQILSTVALAIRNKQTSTVAACSLPTMKKAIEYTMNFLDADGRLTLGNILSGSSLTSSKTDEYIYSNEVYFSLGGYKVPVKFYIKKQSDGKWLLANL